MKTKFLQIHPLDNVLVALQDLKKGEVISFKGSDITLTADISAKHKFFMDDMHAGDDILMYGVLVGKSQYAIAKGSRMDTDNTKHAVDTYCFRPYDYQWTAPHIDSFKGKTFNGYVRSDGRVGTANHWLFIPLVFCENRNLDIIKEALYNELGYNVSEKYKSFTKALVHAHKNGRPLQQVNMDEFVHFSPTSERVFKNIDGIKFLNHQGGCGGTRQDAAILSKLLGAYADHPNVCGITILSLGCQNLQINDFLTDLKDRNPDFDKPIFIFEQQQSKSEEILIKEAITATFEGLVQANEIERQPAPLSKLVLGVKFG